MKSKETKRKEALARAEKSFELKGKHQKSIVHNTGKEVPKYRSKEEYLNLFRLKKREFLSMMESIGKEP